MKVELIVAVDSNGVIGVNGKIPWHSRDDLARFAAITKGHAVIMGRRTWDSLPRKPLTGRMNIVLSKDVNYALSKATVVNSLSSALEVSKLRGYERAFIIGGEGVYKEALAMGMISTVHLTMMYTATTTKPGDRVARFDFKDLPQFVCTETYSKLEVTDAVIY